MSRASGKKNPPREASADPATGDVAQIGGSDRTQGIPSPIPGGRQHISNAPTMPQKVPTPAPRGEYRGVNAHGVQPGTHTTMDRADAMRGITGPKPPPVLYAQREPVLPVPVYLVPVGGGDHPLNVAYAAKFTLPGFNGDPIKIAGRDVNRTRLRVRNVTAGVEVAMGRGPAALVQDVAGTGATITTGLSVPTSNHPANPAAAADFTLTVPAGQTWTLQSITALLTASATVANRTVTIVIDDGTNTIFTWVSPVVQTAGQAVTYTGYPGAVNAAAVSGGVLTFNLPAITLAAGWRIRSVTTNISAGDQWSAIDSSYLLTTTAASALTVEGANLSPAMIGYQDVNTSDEWWACAVHATSIAVVHVLYETTIPNRV